jgi:hypothetical protein
MPVHLDKRFSAAAVALSLAAAGLFAPACKVRLENPKPSPYGHSDNGMVAVISGANACWSFVAYEPDGEHRDRGCGSRDVAVRAKGGAFSVFVFKTDDSAGTVSARLMSDGRTLDQGTATKKNEQIRLVG